MGACKVKCAGQVMTSRQATEWSAHVAETAAETGLSGTNGLFEARPLLLPSCSCPKQNPAFNANNIYL